MSNAKAKTVPITPVPCRWNLEESQARRLRRFKLEDGIKAHEAAIAQLERKHQGLKQDEARQFKMVGEGYGFQQRNLDETVKEVAHVETMIARHKEEIENIKKEIAALALTDEQRSERHTMFDQIAQLQVECERETKEIDLLKAALADKALGIMARKAEMLQLAKKADLTVTGDFGRGRYEAFVRVLPSNLAPECERFTLWLLGLEAKQPCTIRKATEAFPETLTSANCFRQGEVAQLNDTDYARSSYEPPRVPSAFEVEEAMRLEAEQARGNGTFSLGDTSIRLPGSGF